MAYCTKCGKPIEDGVRFCTWCGAEQNAAARKASAEQPGSQPTTVIPAGQPAEQPDSQPTTVIPAATTVLPGAATTPVAATAQPLPSSGATQPYPAVPSYQQPIQQVQPVQTPVQTPYQQQSRQGFSGNHDKVTIGIAAGVIVASLAVILGVFHPWSQGSSTTATTVSAATTSSSAAASSKAATTVAATTSAKTTSATTSSVNETAIYDSLVSYRNRIGQLDESVKDAASNFNNNYTKADSSLRTGYSSSAKSVQSDVASLYAQLKQLNVPATSKNYGSYQKLLTLANDLQHRIDVIVSAWQRDLSYSNPADHTDYILAPIAADNVSGNNKYKTEFDSVWGSSAPTA